MTRRPADEEFDRIERTYGFEFAEDHRAFLAAGLPLNVPFEPEEGVSYAWERPWPDWRDGDPSAVRERLEWPAQGVLFDVEHNAVWHDTWVDRPTGRDEALETARLNLAYAPRLVPVYGHRFLPAGRGTAGHPVLSIMQTDIIYYGTDLVDYIHQEFGGQGMDRTDQRWKGLPPRRRRSLLTPSARAPRRGGLRSGVRRCVPLGRDTGAVRVLGQSPELARRRPGNLERPTSSSAALPRTI